MEIMELMLLVGNRCGWWTGNRKFICLLFGTLNDKGSTCVFHRCIIYLVHEIKSVLLKSSRFC